LVTDKALLKEVTKELWRSVKKLRPELGKDPRMQLVLKALVTIGDLPNQVEAAMVIGACLEMEDDENQTPESKGENAKEKSKIEDLPEGRRVVRRRSAAN
tara:strand:+ start:624 stop:923 length:300 start_codon:yes stop_codon:yes gene_type:complete